MRTLSMALALAALAASAAYASATSEAAAEAAKPKNVRYAFWGNPEAIGVEQEIIDAFHKAQPGIKIEPVVSAYNDYHAKLLTMIAGGAAPEVMRVDSYYFGDFVRANALKELGPLVARDRINMAAYYPQGVEECTYEGKLYGLPWGTAALYMLFNLKVFEKAGVALPPMDWTWDDFEKIAKTLTRGEGEAKVYGFATSLDAINRILPWVWANGGDLFDSQRKTFALDKPEATAAIQRLADLYRQGYMPADAVNSTADTLTRWFINDKIAMFMGAAANILTIQNVEGARFEAGSMPTGKTKQTTLFKSNAVSLSASLRDVEPAWTFVKFLRGPEGQGEALYMKAKRIPPTIDDERYWALYADPNKYPRTIVKVSKEIAKSYGRKLPLRPGWLEVEQLVMPALQSVFLGQATAESAMKAVAPKVQAVLDRTAK